MLTPRSTSTKQSSSLLISFLFLIIILTTLIYFLQTSSVSFVSPPSSSNSHISPSSSSTPSIPESLNPSSPLSKIVLFSEHSTYENLSHEYDHLWDELLPQNGGFLRVYDEDIKSNGKENTEGKKGEVQNRKKHKYGITMFHSLHCLGIMRGGVQELFREMEELKMEVAELKMGKREDDEEMEDDEERESKMRREQKKRAGGGHGHGHDFGHMEHGDPLHWLHCFDYLRQTVLCTADGTLEPPKADSKGKENVDGMMERQCKDPEELWKLSVESFEATS
ncbi:uncharacterized protein EAF02_001158 [Botrytis sinoallii]|uniref:uncharacterized protein n=1 Tax=Botrytis sinoallii TaxID=1463999 RepID=UPI0019006E80|nr:uncharacterized protein EAF02_001158 [Botrytis sinoallii]KAF7893620.1 hypothetical protein EAF02_001158 [Botrytis sinoallii]